MVALLTPSSIRITPPCIALQRKDNVLQQPWRTRRCSPRCSADRYLLASNDGRSPSPNLPADQGDIEFPSNWKVIKDKPEEGPDPN